MSRSLAWLGGIIAIFALMLILFPAFGRDLGQWKTQNPEISAWYGRQMQPDNPAISCCGKADAYEANDFATEGDQYFAIITDTRNDGPLMRPHIPAGTRVYIPPNKMKRNNTDPNPTGNGIVFIGISGQVWCYFAPSLM